MNNKKYMNVKDFIKKFPQTRDWPSDRPVIKARGICKRFITDHETISILENASLDLFKGDIAAVTGESGSGKSTLLNILCGIERADSGSVEIFDTSVDRASEDYLARFRNRHIGIVFQSYNLLPDFTVLQNVMMPGLIYSKNWGQAKKRALFLLERVGILNRRHHKIGEMSGGELQRAAIARALLVSPDIIVADEPTGNLDEENSDRVFNLFIDLCKEQNITVLIVTHSKEIAKKCFKHFQIRGKTISGDDF